jgi:hypothetical protein
VPTDTTDPAEVERLQREVEDLQREIDRIRRGS